MLDPAEQLEHLKLAAQVAGVDVAEIVLPEDRDVKVGNLRLHYLTGATRIVRRWCFCTAGH